MKVKVLRRAICLYCGARLRLHTRTVDVRAGETPEEAAARNGLAPDRITKVYRDWRGAWLMVSCWTGHYGPEGDDRFCSKSDGYRFAVERVDPPVRWQSES